MLAVRGDIVAFFAQHFVEFRASVATHKFDATAWKLLRQIAQQIEQARVEFVGFRCDPIGE